MMIARLRPEQLGGAPARKLRMNGKSHIQNNFPIAPRGDFFLFRSRFPKDKRVFS
jgi:hypothetical protein